MARSLAQAMRQSHYTTAGQPSGADGGYEHSPARLSVCARTPWPAWPACGLLLLLLLLSRFASSPLPSFAAAHHSHLQALE